VNGFGVAQNALYESHMRKLSNSLKPMIGGIAIHWANVRPEMGCLADG
jgi:hypothetical protein